MRIRIGGVIAFASVMAWAVSACTTAGVSFIYMAIDTGGKQPRNVFWTDSTNIYCIAKFSAARPDATLDFRVVQNGVYPWCSPPGKIPAKPDTTPADIHKTFAVGEATPGVGVETSVSFQLFPQGISLAVMCTGIITQNLPSGSTACGVGLATGAGYCDADHINEGADSAGPGFTCCAPLPGTAAAAATAVQVTAPYPAGTYTCIVSLDGVIEGQTDFTILFPDPPGPPPQPGEPVPCPVPPPVNHVPCYNWVQQGTSCAGFEGGQMCVCAMSGLWECQ